MPDGTLLFEDATVDYDLRGDGPPLLLIPGGSGDAGMIGPLAEHLADHYTVISMYSRLASARGNSETSLGAAAAALGDQHPAGYADDAFRLLDKLTDEPAVVFGFSAGAIVALELTMRHPDRVRLGVVHETLLVHLLPDAERLQTMFESARETARTEGAAAANAVIGAGVTAGAPDAAPVPVRHFGDWLDRYADTEPEPPAPELAAVVARIGELHPAFLEHVLVQFTTHVPDADALQAVAAKLVPIAGIDSRGQVPYRAAAALAARLDVPLTEFPGGHLGSVERPTQFAETLVQLLDNLH